MVARYGQDTSYECGQIHEMTSVNGFYFETFLWPVENQSGDRGEFLYFTPSNTVREMFMVQYMVQCAGYFGKTKYYYFFQYTFLL